MSKSVQDILKTEFSTTFEEFLKTAIQHLIDSEKVTGKPFTKIDVANKFIQLMKHAMVTSYYKYGPVVVNHGEENYLDAIANLEKRLDKYKQSGNTEFLVDVANFAMIEFMSPQKPKEDYIAKRPTTPAIQNFNLWGLETDLEDYKVCRDTVLLPKIAIGAMCEFIDPKHEKAFYVATESGACENHGFGINEIKNFEERSR